MLKIVKQSIGVRISLFINIILIVVISAGFVVIYMQQEQNLENQFKTQGKMASMLGAKGVGTIIEEAIDNGTLTLEEAFDAITIPIPGFDPPKFQTRYDEYLDKAVLSFIDKALESEEILYAKFHDKNGYLPTHNSRYQQEITGNRETDLKGNRTKRILSDKVAENAITNKEDGFFQVYHRDTGEIVWDFSSPLFVKGTHWGCFRTGILLDKVKIAKKKSMIILIIIFITIIGVSVVTVILMTGRALSPLNDFVRIASALADGNIDKPIEAKTSDELGRLADALERLRVSLNAAMNRLKRR